MPNGNRTAAEWGALAELGDAAQHAAQHASGVREYAETLARSGHHADAIKLLAHLLPKREAVWWAWACAKRAGKDTANATAALAATERWIAQQDDAHRRAALTAAQAADTGTAAGAAGLAAFLSGESLAPAGAQTVAPGEFLAAKAVAASVMLAAVECEPQHAEAKNREFEAKGFEVAQRIHLWERLESAAPEAEKNGDGTAGRAYR